MAAGAAFSRWSAWTRRPPAAWSYEHEAGPLSRLQFHHPHVRLPRLPPPDTTPTSCRAWARRGFRSGAAQRRARTSFGRVVMWRLARRTSPDTWSCPAPSVIRDYRRSGRERSRAAGGAVASRSCVWRWQVRLRRRSRGMIGVAVNIHVLWFPNAERDLRDGGAYERAREGGRATSRDHRVLRGKHPSIVGGAAQGCRTGTLGRVTRCLASGRRWPVRPDRRGERTGDAVPRVGRRRGGSSPTASPQIRRGGWHGCRPPRRCASSRPSGR